MGYNSYAVAFTIFCILNNQVKIMTLFGREGEEKMIRTPKGLRHCVKVAT